VMFGALWWVQSDWKRRDRILPGVVFTLFVLLTSGILVFKLLHAAKVDPFQGAHDPSENSLDLFSILIPGGHWKFSRLTEFFWGQLPGNINESSVHLGFAGCIMLGVAWAWRKKVQQFSPNRWFVVLGFFFIMSLGPKLEIFGHQIPWFYLPYRLLEIMLPPLRLSGCPQRMVVMVNLCAAILIPAALQMMSQSRVKVKSFASVLLVLLFFEFLPAAMPETDSRMPEFVEFLKSEPRGYAMIDVDANVPEGRALLYQTRHQIPMFGGYISRYPLSVVLKDNEIRRQIELGQFKGLCEDLGFRYLLFKGDGRSRVIAGRTFSAVYSGEGYEIYDLVEGWTCINHVRKV
jgi:hypothetical protein